MAFRYLWKYMNFHFIQYRIRDINKWRGVTISLRTGGQGRPTPIHTPNPRTHLNIQKKYLKRSFLHFFVRSLPTDWPTRWTDGRTDRRMDGRTDGWMDGRTDRWAGKASYRVACLQLKKKTFCRDNEFAFVTGGIPLLVDQIERGSTVGKLSWKSQTDPTNEF